MPTKTRQARPEAAPPSPRARKTPRRPATAAAEERQAAEPLAAEAAEADVPAVAAKPPARKAARPRRRKSDVVPAEVVEAAAAVTPEPAPEPVAPPSAQPEASADDAHEPADERPRRSRSRRRAASPAAPAAQQPAPPSPPAAPAGPPARIQPPADGAIFGRYVVQIPGEEDAELTLRNAYPGTALCTCLDFALSESGDCPHVQAVNAYLQADRARAEALARGPQQPGSRIAVLHGARRRLLWLPGTECPSALNDLADEVLGVPPDELDDQAVPRLLRAAREAGHPLQVDDSVWTHLAAERDARWRVHRLQALMPEGPASPLLNELRPDAEPLLPLQAEAALFAVCAGRCILADTPELQPMQQALTAIALWRLHFGVERVLVLAPSQALDRWRRALPPDERVGLMALENVATDPALHRSLDPELLVVHEPDGGGLWVDADRAAALLRLRSAHAIVLPPADWPQHPAELPLRLAFVDAERRGPYAALLHEHGLRDEAGELCGLHELEDLRDTLPSVLLMRPLDEVRALLPERVDRVRRVALPAADRARHGRLAAALGETLSRWQRLGWLPDSAQRQLLDQVQGLRRLCAGDGADNVLAAKADAVCAWLADAEAPVAKGVVFSQWPDAVRALQRLLARRGVGAVCHIADDGAAACRQAVQHWSQDEGCRLILVADPGASALELPARDAQVLHLDRPWNPRMLTRRFGRVHKRGKAHLVPVIHLVAEGSFEDGVLQVLADRREPLPDLLDGNAAEGFLQGDVLTQWLADLAAVLALATGPSA